MSGHLGIHFFGLILVALVAGGLAGWALVRDPLDGRFEFVTLAAAVVLWTIDSGWMLFLDEELGLLFGYYVQSFFEWVTPAIFLLFVISYSRNERWLDNPAVKLYLAGVPLAFLLAAFTNPAHGLLFTELTVNTDPFGMVTATPGPLLYLAGLYTYTSLSIGLIVIGRIAVRSNQVAKRQAVALGISVFAVVATSVAQLLGTVPLAGFNYTVIAFGGFYAALGYLFLRDPALDIGPLARQRLVESLDTGIVILTPDHKIADYNRTATVAFPAIEDGIGQSIDEVAPELFETARGNGVDDEEDGDEVETITVTVDDEQVELNVELSPVREDGEIRGYGIVMNDVTELQAYARQLEEKSDQLDQFASMVSHDLRNPLTVAQTNIGFVLNGVDDEDIAEYGEEADEALDRAETLIEDLLTLAREGRSIQEREYVDLEYVAVTARATTILDGDQSTIDLDEGVEVYADEERLRTVFENLFRNAVDHVGDDVHLQVGLLDDGTGFYIEDDGPGIPDDEVDEVLEHGFTTSEDGTGLGLSIVSSIVDAHGWDVEVVANGPELGGARFEIETSEVRSSNEGAGDEEAA